MNDDNSPTGDTSADDFIRSNTIKIPAVLALEGADAVEMVAGTITNPVRIPVRIESSEPGRASGNDPMTETRRSAAAFPVSSEPNGDKTGLADGASMAPRRRRR